MKRALATTVAVALLFVGWTGVGAAADGQPGYIASEGSPVKSAPAYDRGRILFRANQYEPVTIRCQVEDQKAEGLMWMAVDIRDTTGWVVDAARRDVRQPIPPCGDSRAA